MTVAAAFAAGLAAIDAVFGEPIFYAGGGVAVTVDAIRSDLPGDDYSGYAGKSRQVTFEIAASALPRRPAKSDTITAGIEVWRVIDINEMPEIGRWRLWVQR